MRSNWFSVYSNLNGGSEDFFIRQSLSSTPKQRRWADIQLPSPLRDGLGFALKCQIYAITAIVALLFLSCPPTIFRTVVAIYINAVKGMVGCRALPHIIIEIFKFQPLVTHANAASRIIGICAWIFGIASSDHTSPYFIGSSGTHTMRCGLNANSYVIFTSATDGIFQIAGRRFSQRAAFALTPPVGMSTARLSCISNHGAESEGHSRQILKTAIVRKWFKNNVIFSVGHEVYSYLVNFLARAVKEGQLFFSPLSFYHV